MKENIKILTNDCCEDLLAIQGDPNLKSVYNSDEFPSEKLQFVNSITSYFVDSEVQLDPKPESDGENSIIIFNQLKNLDRVQANDRRLWVSLTHLRFYSYTRHRWYVGEKTPDLIRRFHYEGSSLETRVRNSISRLWWAAKLTFDENIKDDPFKMTKILWKRQDLIQNIVERSYVTYPNVVRGILEFCEINHQLSEDNLRNLFIGLNAIGGVKVLSLLNISDIKDELKRVAIYKGIKIN